MVAPTAPQPEVKVAKQVVEMEDPLKELDEDQVRIRELKDSEIPEF